MATRHRKTRKLRGSRTHGWGRSGQHRNSGSQGGHGKAGLRRHKKSMVIRYGIQMGERGFKPVNPQNHHTINIGDVTEHLEQFIEDGHVKQDNGTTTVDLAKAGYDKLLGEGRISQPLRLVIAHTSEKAAQKVAQAGGQVIPPEQHKPAVQQPEA